MKWLVGLAVMGCAASPPPAPHVVVVERVVYVQRAPERVVPVERADPGPPLPPSPLLEEREERRVELAAERDAREAPPAVVYETVPVAVAVYVDRSAPRRLTMLERQRLDRELKRCDRRPTKWSRERCEERARAR